jgi:hypothetical protein
MSRTPWGALLRRDLAGLVPLLVLGCEPPRVEPVTPPAPPASQALAVASVLPPAPAVPPGLGPAVDLFPTAADASSRFLEEEIIPSGRGLLVVRRWRGWDREFIPRCPVAGLDPRSCEGMVLIPSTSRTQEDSFPRWEGALGEASPLRPIERPWSHFSGGKHGVYAHEATGEEKPGTLGLDVIDEQGKLSRFEATLTENPELGFSGVAVVETPADRRIIGERQDRKTMSSSLVFAVIEERAGKSSVVRPKSLKLAPLPQASSTAQYARAVAASGARVAFGPWQAVPAIDAHDKPERSVLLVWTEATPPPKIDRRTPRVDPAPAAVTSRGAWQRTPTSMMWLGSMGCGAPSRKLAEASTRKQMHVTRLSLAGDVLKDAVVPFPAGFDPATSPLPPVLPRPGGLQIGSLLLDHELRPTTEISPVLLRPTPAAPSSAQGIVQAAFDPAAREGIVIMQQGERRLARRFDALGQPLGEVTEFTGEVLLQRDKAVLGRGARGWFALGGDEFRITGRLHPVGSGGSPLFLPGAQASGWSSWPREGWGQDFYFKGLFRSSHGDLGVVAEDFHGDRRVALVAPDASRVADPTPLGGARVQQRLPGLFEGDHGLLVLDDMTVRDDEGAHPLPEEATSLAGVSAETHFHRVWNDIVMVRQSRAAISGTWLRQGVTRRLSQAEAIRAGDQRPSLLAKIMGSKRPSHINRRDDIGEFEPPLLLDGRAVLPATPGDVSGSEPLAPLRDDCPFIVPTEADRLVLVCVDVRGSGAAGTAVTLRTFRFEPPPATPPASAE